MKWWDFLDYGPVYQSIVKKIDVRQLGIAKVIVVRTKKNGGIRVTNIPVKA